MSKVVDIIKRIFVNNWKMKLIALIFALVLWSFMIAETNPPKSKVFKDIPVTFTAADELKQKGLTSTVPLSELLKSVTVEAETNADALQYLNENMIRATVDLSSINDVGEYTLPVKATSTFSQSTIVSKDPETVTITIEEIASREVPVEVKLTGDQKDWLYYGQPVLDEANVSVSGSKSNVEKVSKAICYINIDSMETSTKESYKVTLVDSNGNELSGDLFTGVPSVIVEMRVYPKKDVPIDTEAVKSSITGLASGFEISKLTVDPETVSIAGTLENIDPVTSVSLEPIDLEGAQGDMIIEAKVKLPEGVIAATPSTVKLQLSISQPEIMRTYSAKEIRARNLEDGLTASISPTAIDINVYGTQEVYDTNDITSSKIKPFVDLTGLSKGVHENVPVKFENEPDLGVRLEPSQATVTVTIT